jgi:hypothetical protein
MIIVSLIAVWLMVAFLTESLTEVIKNLFPTVIKDKATYSTSIVIGIVLAYAFGLNIFGLVGAGVYVSYVVAGVLASRGANYVNGLLSKLGIVK